ncbi:MAG: hypothetical protein AAFX02_00905 [Pseudomonadota bacterium]
MDLTEEHELEITQDLEAIRFRAEGRLGRLNSTVSGGKKNNVIEVNFGRNAES